MKFNLQYVDTVEERVLTYVTEDYSFNSDPIVHVVKFSIMVNYITLSVVEDNRVVEVWGYCPFKNWIKAEYKVPIYKTGLLKVIDNVEEGFSYGVNEGHWPIYVNNKTGWVCIGNPEKTESAVEFMKNCVAIIDQNKELVTLWLKPQKLPKLWSFKWLIKKL